MRSWGWVDLGLAAIDQRIRSVGVCGVRRTHGEAFRDLDRNGDGSLTPDELEAEIFAARCSAERNQEWQRGKLAFNHNQVYLNPVVKVLVSQMGGRTRRTRAFLFFSAQACWGQVGLVLFLRRGLVC